MSIHMTKTWFVDGKIIEQVIPESEIYKQPWVGLTNEDISEIVRGTHNTVSFVRAIEAKLKEKNNA